MAENNISSAAIILKAKTSELERGLDKASGILKDKAKGWNATLKDTFSGAFAGGFAGQIFGKLGGKFTEGLTKNLENGLEKMADFAKRLAGWRKQIGETETDEEAGQRRLRELDQIGKNLDQQREQWTSIRQTLAGVQKNIDQFGASDLWKKWDDFRRALKDMSRIPQEEKNRSLNKYLELLREEQKLVREQAAKRQDWANAVKGTGDFFKERIDRMKEALELNLEFADSNEKLRMAMEKLNKLNGTGLLKDGVFEKARKKLRDDILGPAEFRFAGGDRIGSKEAAEDILRARFGQQKAGQDPIEKANEKLAKGNEQRKRGNDLLEELVKIGPFGMSGRNNQFVFEEFNP